jgi:hypothetical protein
VSPAAPTVERRCPPQQGRPGARSRRSRRSRRDRPAALEEPSAEGVDIARILDEYFAAPHSATHQLVAAFHRVYVPIHRNEHIAAAALRADKIWCATASTQRGAHTSLFNAAALGLLDRVQQNLESQLLPEQITHALWAACHGGQQTVPHTSSTDAPTSTGSRPGTGTPRWMPHGATALMN